jgi:hypothetical protein
MIMAVEATGSKYKQKTGYILAVMFLAFAAYCLYDGWYSQDFIRKHTVDGRPDINLQANRIWIPALLALAAIYEIATSLRLAAKRITLDDRGLTLSGQTPIPCDQITYIDKRFFQSEGHFTIGYNDPRGSQKLKLSDRNYDNLVPLFDELVKRTGAAPAENKSDAPANS